MRKGILILNGNLCNISNRADIIVCADGGLTNAISCGILPDVIIGDLDSNSIEIPLSVKLIKYNIDKSKTDGQLALEYLIADNCTDIEIYCALGGRLDHQLMNINLMYIALLQNINIQIIDNNVRLFLINSSGSFNVNVNDIVSLLPFSDTVHIMNSSGLRYAIDNILIDKSLSLTVSNVAVSSNITIAVSSGILLVTIYSS